MYCVILSSCYNELNETAVSSSQPGSRVAKCGRADAAAGESLLSKDKEKSEDGTLFFVYRVCRGGGWKTPLNIILQDPPILLVGSWVLGWRGGHLVGVPG